MELITGCGGRMAAGWGHRKEQGWGKEGVRGGGGKAASQGEQGPRDGREGDCCQPSQVSLPSDKRCSAPLGGVWLRVWLVWLRLSLEPGCEIEE